MPSLPYCRLLRSSVPACLALLVVIAIAGCGRTTLRADERPASRPVGDLGMGYFDERVEAFVVPPEGWTLDDPKIGEERVHLTWLSPTGDTAFGVVYFPVPAIAALVPSRKYLHERALPRFIEELQADQGEGTLISSEWDEEREAMRFVAEGGLYKIRPILTIRGRTGWSVYSGTLRENEERPDELEVAKRAREATRVGRDAEGGADAAARVLQRMLPTTRPNSSSADE